MDETLNTIIRNIKKRIRLRKIFILICALTLILGILSFLFYGFDNTTEAIKFISKKDQISDVEKVMSNPRIKFEHSNNQLFDISARKAVHKNKGDVELYDVKASGTRGNISAGILLITNNGNDLYFSNNPVLIIKEVKNEQ
jgi:hypothetical protein